MICKYCKKPLPDIQEDKCPFCFAKWFPEDDKKYDWIADNKKIDHDTVNGHE